jgi:hypothetical protein
MTILGLGRHTIVSLIWVGLLAACGGQPLALVTEAPTKAPAATPNATAVPTQAVVSATATTQQTITTAVSSEPPRFPTPDASKFPKDKAGRVLGGNQPIINYAPDMVTSKSCPRVTKWQPRPLKQVSGPAGDYFVASDPCVVQNAIDDFVQIAWAIPWYNDREQMLELEKLYVTDPVLKKGIDPAYFKRGLEGKNYMETWIAYRLCDPALVSLIVPSEQSKMDRTGKVLELGLVDVTRDLKPTTCKTHRFDTGVLLSQGPVLGEADKQKGVTIFAFWMFWSDSTQRWQFGGLANPFGKLTLQQVQSLYNAAKYKP